jgi:hypothetical protein
MDDKQLAQVLSDLEESTAFAPGQGRQLAPASRLEDRTAAARDTIIESSLQLASNMKALYQERVVFWQRKLERVTEITNKLVERSQEVAEEVAGLTERDRKIIGDLAVVMEKNGIDFE